MAVAKMGGRGGGRKALPPSLIPYPLPLSTLLRRLGHPRELARRLPPTDSTLDTYGVWLK